MGTASDTTQSSTDIFFHCSHCSASLVVDRAASGLTLNCQRCGQPTTVPRVNDDVRTAELVADLERQLRENESQRTEITNYINQLSIQLHRWQHRLTTLNNRHDQILADINDPQTQKEK